MNCSSVSDCLGLIIPGINDWCIEAVSCDTKYHECTVWPRCRNFPLLGCLNGPHECVTTRLEPNPSTGPSSWSSAPYVIAFMICIGFVLGIAFFSTRHALREYRRWLHKKYPTQSHREARESIVEHMPVTIDQLHTNMVASF